MTDLFDKAKALIAAHPFIAGFIAGLIVGAML